MASNGRPKVSSAHIFKLNIVIFLTPTGPLSPFNHIFVESRLCSCKLLLSLVIRSGAKDVKETVSTRLVENKYVNIYNFSGRTMSMTKFQRGLLNELSNISMGGLGMPGILAEAERL